MFQDHHVIKITHLNPYNKTLMARIESRVHGGEENGRSAGCSNLYTFILEVAETLSYCYCEMGKIFFSTDLDHPALYRGL